MKILLINNRHFYGGGTETVYFNTAELLRKAGHEVVFFSVMRENNLPSEQDEYFVKQGGKLSRLKKYFYNKDAADQISKLIEAERPDIAHVHLLWGGLSPSILVALKRYRIPIVHTVHEYRMVCPAYLLKDGKGRQCERCNGGKFYQCLQHKCSKGSFTESLFMTMEIYFRNRYFYPIHLIDGFIFVSNFTRNKHIEFNPDFSNVTSEVIYNCPNEIINESKTLVSDSYNSYYLYYGRLSVEKGVNTLIRAFEKYPQLKLRIVGTGPLDDEIKRLCVDKGLNNVELLGFRSGKDLFDIVAQAKYVCVPSECYENNPMTVVEAYSLGVPVIGAGIGGTAEIVRDGETGLTFESGNVDSLIDVIGKSDKISKEEYMKQREVAHEFSVKNFSRESHISKLLDFYNLVINKVKNA